MEKVALIMAGGRGERFWPRSRVNTPKQFLSLTDDGKTMIQHAIDRIRPLVPIENVYVATNILYKELVTGQIPDLPEANILCEPIARNTAPCIGLAAVAIRKQRGDCVMMVLSSDHLIKNQMMFLDTLKKAILTAEEENNLVTIGIPPTYPETGYGYIKFNPATSEDKPFMAYEVDKIVEKPQMEKAKEYVNSGQYLWNGGMFIWKISTIMSNIEQHLPAMFEGLGRIEDALGTDEEKSVLEKEFMQFRSESIDYGIMEKAENVYTVPATFSWDDVGSWLSLERINPTNELGNVVQGNVVSIHTRNCTISGSEKLIATVGLENMIIIDTSDALLVCDKNATQDVKLVLENLRICNRTEYL